MSELLRDPYAVAMVATGALAGLGLLLAAGARLSGKRAGAMGWLLGLSLLGFLGSAVAGTAERIDNPGAAAAAGEADGAKTAQASDEGSNAGAVANADGNDGASGEGEEDKETPSKPGEGAAPGGPEGEDGSPAGAAPVAPPAAPTGPAGGSLDPVPALPSDPKEARQAVRRILVEGKTATGRYCTDAARVGNAWAKLHAMPTDVHRAKAKVIARRLEACRRKVTWTTTYALHKRRLATRNRYPKQLRKTLKTHGLRDPYIALSGGNHQRLRIGARQLDESKVASLMQAMGAEFQDLGFESVTFARSGKSWRRPLQPRPEADLVRDTLRPWGLAAPLRLPSQ